MTRWLAPLAILIVALAAALYYQHDRQRTAAASFPAPDFALNDLGGRSHRLSAYRGKIVFLNFWATWCPPCREEMPSMERLYRRLGHGDFAMLAVNEDEDGAPVVRQFVDGMGLSFPVLLDVKGTVPPRYGVTGYPETFVIDRSGQVVNRFIGPADWDSAALRAYFAQLLDERAATE